MRKLVSGKVRNKDCLYSKNEDRRHQPFGKTGANLLLCLIRGTISVAIKRK